MIVQYTGRVGLGRDFNCFAKVMIHIILLQQLVSTTFLFGLRNIIYWECSGEDSAGTKGGAGGTLPSWALL